MKSLFFLILFFPTLLLSKEGGVVGNGGDGLSLIFRKAQINLPSDLEKVKECSMSYNIPIEYKQWYLDHKAELIQDIELSAHHWQKKIKSGKCAETSLKRNAPIAFSYENCRVPEVDLNLASQILIHESIHHLGKASEEFADKLAFELNNAKRADDCDQFGYGTLELKSVETRVLSSNRKKMATLDPYRGLVIWDLKTRKIDKQFENVPYNYKFIGFDPSEKFIYAASNTWDSKLISVNTSNGVVREYSELYNLWVGMGSSETGHVAKDVYTFSSDSKYLALKLCNGNYDCPIKVLNTETGSATSIETKYFPVKLKFAKNTHDLQILTTSKMMGDVLPLVCQIERWTPLSNATTLLAETYRGDPYHYHTDGGCVMNSFSDDGLYLYSVSDSFPYGKNMKGDLFDLSQGEVKLIGEENVNYNSMGNAMVDPTWDFPNNQFVSAHGSDLTSWDFGNGIFYHHKIAPTDESFGRGFYSLQNGSGILSLNGEYWVTKVCQETNRSNSCHLNLNDVKTGELKLTIALPSISWQDEIFGISPDNELILATGLNQMSLMFVNLP